MSDINRVLDAPVEKAAPRRTASLAVLEKRWLRCAERRDWQTSLDIADQIVTQHAEEPLGWIWQSVSLHKLKRTQRALDQLLTAAERFPQIPIIYYHLACYTCQLGQFKEAARWWSKALALGNKDLLTMMAANEDDLRPLWHQAEMPA